MTHQIPDKYEFHDNLIHGISFGAIDFKSEIQLDIDYILHWPSCESDSTSLFTLSKALLIFTNVTDLMIHVDWGNSSYTSSSSGFSINRIERENVVTTLRLPHYYKYVIHANNEKDMISFGASSMRLELIGNPIFTPNQHLTDAERKAVSSMQK